MSLLLPLLSHSALPAPQNSTRAYVFSQVPLCHAKWNYTHLPRPCLISKRRSPSSSPRRDATPHFFALTDPDGERSPRMTPLRREDDEDEEDGGGEESGEARHVCGQSSRPIFTSKGASSRRGSMSFKSQLQPWCGLSVCPWSSLRPREIESKAQNCFTPLHR